MAEADFSNVLCLANPDTGQISVPTYLSHDPMSRHYYVVRRLNSCGYQEQTTTAAVVVSVGANGQLIEPAPNRVFGLKSEQTGGGRLRLVWFYCPLDQTVVPEQFQIFWDNGTGQINLGSPLAITPYEGRRFYAYRSDNLNDGRYLFIVNAASKAGIENASSTALHRQVKSPSPEAVNILAAEAV